MGAAPGADKVLVQIEAASDEARSAGLVAEAMANRII